MRRRISLYIGGQLADLADDGLILFNYEQEDLSNPAVVRNSYSKQVTLPGTPANDAIFGHIYRPDRVTDYTGSATGTGFDPSARTPFEIYAETGEVLEAGYVRLDSATRKGGITEYKATLFGGLGSFFYALTYTDEGERLSLADIDYLGTGDPAELDFDITAATVTDAWSALLNGSGADVDKWRVLNFAAAYEGTPEGDFDAGKGIATLSAVGLEASRTQDGKTYTSPSGKTIVKLADKRTAQEVKDLRSYLQRPVLSIDAFLDALTNPANAGGYVFDWSAVKNAAGYQYNGL